MIQKKRQNPTSAPLKFSPLLQSVLKKHEKSMKALYELSPHLTMSIKDAELSKQLTRFFIASDIEVHTTIDQKPDALLKLIPRGLLNKNIVILNYQGDGGKALLNLLRGIKEHSPNVSFASLIPLFISNSSRKSMDIPRSLGALGIKTMIVLPVGLTVDQSINQLLTSLAETVLAKKSKKKTAVPAQMAVQMASMGDTKKLEEYKQLMHEAEKLMQEEQFDKAIELFTKAIELHPEPSLLLERGDAFYRISHYIQALNDYREAAKLEHSLPAPFAKIASCCFLMAKSDLLNKENAKAAKKVQLALSYLKQSKEAIDNLLKSHKKSPEYLPASPYGSLLSAFALSGQVPPKMMGENVVKEINKLLHDVLESLPETEYNGEGVDIDVRIDYASLLTRQHQFDKADRIFTEIVKAAPEYARSAYNNFAVELRRAKQYGRAYEIYLLLLETKSDDQKIIIENLKVAGLNYAVSLREEFKIDEAIQVYKKLLSFQPKEREWILCELAMTYLELQQQSDASSRVMEAIYINPSLVKSERFQKNYPDLNHLRSEMIKKLTDNL